MQLATTIVKISQSAKVYLFDSPKLCASTIFSGLLLLNLFYLNYQSGVKYYLSQWKFLFEMLFFPVDNFLHHLCCIWL